MQSKSKSCFPFITMLLLLTASSDAADKSLGATDCACATDTAGKYCGGTKYLKNDQGKGCRPYVVYKCGTDAGTAGVYPDVDSDAVERCPAGQTCVSATPGNAKCGVPTGKSACMCKNQDKGNYCGGGQYLTGDNCFPGTLYSCGKNDKGVATPVKRCSDTPCVSGTPGKAFCKPGMKDCKCKNEAEGDYCGGSPDLMSAAGEGCRQDFKYTCPANGGKKGTYATKEMKCNTDLVCKSAKPGTAKCQPK